MIHVIGWQIILPQQRSAALLSRLSSRVFVSVVQPRGIVESHCDFDGPFGPKSQLCAQAFSRPSRQVEAWKRDHKISSGAWASASYCFYDSWGGFLIFFFFFRVLGRENWHRTGQSSWQNPASADSLSRSTWCSARDALISSRLVKGGIDHISRRKNRPFHRSRPVKKEFHETFSVACSLPFLQPESLPCLDLVTTGLLRVLLAVNNSQSSRSAFWNWGCWW